MILKYADFLLRMREIEGMGYVRSHRLGDTGIGKTLEDLLGIAENNIAGPDFSTHELKAARRASASMLTLFTKAPLPRGVATRRLLSAFGYPDEVPLRDKELHVTVDSLKPNRQGLRLKVDRGRVWIDNKKGVEAYYTGDILREAFERKYRNLAYVLADHRMDDQDEYFHYNEVRLLGGFSFDRFLQSIASGELKLDLRIGHYPNGRPHDHGTGFRMLPKNLPNCFRDVQQVL